MATIKAIKRELKKEKGASCWARGVLTYAAELLDDLDYIEEQGEELTKYNCIKTLRNGADSWSSYSWGGCSLIYNGDICERLATPSEQKRTRGGELRPNGLEEWLDCQARALTQASNIIYRIVLKLDNKGAR